MDWVSDLEPNLSIAIYLILNGHSNFVVSPDARGSGFIGLFDDLNRVCLHMLKIHNQLIRLANQLGSKDHFGWIDPAYGRFPGSQRQEADKVIAELQPTGALGPDHALHDELSAHEDVSVAFPPDVGMGVPHGYGQTSLYDGLVQENDDYHQVGN